MTTRRDATAGPAPDLAQREFQAAGAIGSGWPTSPTSPPAPAYLILAVVLDAWSRRVVGWAMAAHLRTQLVMDALDRALRSRRPERVIHHSDHGCQYTSIAFGLRCREAGVQPSMGSVGDAYDNALCERFFATLECELLDQRRFAARAEARPGVERAPKVVGGPAAVTGRLTSCVCPEPCSRTAGGGSISPTPA